jgi:2-methylcitrate dehydratase PrpD
LNRTLGHRYEILRTGFKQHACCRGFHSTIDGLYELIRAEGLKHADIARVVIGTDRDTVRYSVREPETFLAAQMSYPFSVASALVRGNCGVQSYNEDELKNREVLDLAKRIQLVVDHRVNESYPRKWGSRVNIVLRNGKRISKTFWHAKGEPEKPFTRKELDQKFVTLASLTHSSERVQAIMEAIHRLENLDNVSVLCLMLSSDTEHGVTPNVVRN